MDRFELANFNLNLLVALDALLGERSVSAAAKLTRVTPSAMSHSLAELRALLEDPLLVRSGRGMVLTPRAEALGPPLRKVLLDARRLLAGGTSFDPATAGRRFVIAAPDFLATLLLPPLLEGIALEAPGIVLDVVPSARRGNAWLLETGEVDLALGAIVDHTSAIRRMDLFTEGFVCAARKRAPGYPRRAERVQAPLRMESAAACLRFEQESFGALHQMLSSLDQPARDAAGQEVGRVLAEFEREGAFVGPCELVVAVGTK